MIKLFAKYHKFLSLSFFMIISMLYFGTGVISHFATALSGTGVNNTVDNITAVWDFAWFPHALLHNLNPFITTVVWSPEGVNLTKLNSIPALSILFMPITLLWGPIVSYNLVALLAPALAAWTAYLLCYYLIKSSPCALVGGYLFGFSSYMFGHMWVGHTCLVAAVFLLPLFPLIFLKWLDNKISSLKFIILFTIIMVLLFFIAPEIPVIFTCWSSLTLLIAIILFKEHRAKLILSIKYLIIIYLLIMLIISPYLYYFFTDSLTSFAVNPSSYYVNDLLSIFIPSSAYLLSNHWATQITATFPGNQFEWNLYLGIGLVLLLIIYAKQFWRTRVGKFLIIISCVLAIASLGPMLHIAGKVIVNFPWSVLFTKLPVIDAALPARIGILANLPIAICVAWWIKNSPWKLIYRFIFLGFALLFLIPSFNQNDRATFTIPYVPKFFSTPVYKQYLTSQDNVLIFPYHYSPQLLWQVKTNLYFNLAGGYLGTVPYLYLNDVTQFLNSTPEYYTKEKLAGFLLRHAVTKIIVVNHYNYDGWKPLLLQIDAHPQLTNEVNIYHVDSHRLNAMLFSCPTKFYFDSNPEGKGWSVPEKQPSGEYYMWMANTQASMKIMNACRGPVIITLHIPLAIADDILNTLQVYIEGRLVSLQNMGRRDNKIILQGKTNLELPKNQPLNIQFNVARTIPQSDGRNLAVMFSEMEIYEEHS